MEPIEGKFEVIDSFVIRKRNEFCLIGEIRDGNIKENWFVNIPLNGQISLTLRIISVDEIEMTSDRNKKYTLLTVQGDNEELDFFLSLNVGSELLNVTIDGKD